MSSLPQFLRKSKTRRFVIKNHIYSSTNISWLYLQSFVLRGSRARAEGLLVFLLSRLKYILSPSIILSMVNWILSSPIEISPVRLGKKIKMIPRLSAFQRQFVRSAFFLSSALRSRQTAGAAFIAKIYKEIVSGLFFADESTRMAQQAIVYMAGFFNLRYLSKRWF